jgi:CRISPR-associated protein Csd1
MMLQALYRYYQRRNQHPDPARHLPAYGFEEREVPYLLELASDGTLLGISATGQKEGKRHVGTRYLVPMGVKRASGIAANLLWDNAEYVLAVPDAKKLEAAQAKGKAEDYLARLQEMQAAFTQRIATLPASAQADAGIQAVRAFLGTDTAYALQTFPVVAAEISAANPVLSFRLAGDLELVCQRPQVKATVAPVAEVEADDVNPKSQAACLITGEVSEVERLHTAIKGVWGAQTSGANIVSFNAAAYQSHGKEQGANAPVSPAAAFAYTTALNALLARDSRQRMQVGDASTVFWAEEEDPFENAFGSLFGESVDDPDAHTSAVRALYAAVHSGAMAADEAPRRFFVLGLAPNAARLSVRFWHVSTVQQAALHITQWFDDLAVAHAEHEPPYPSLYRLLSSVALQGKADNIPPRLGGDVLRAALAGTPLPSTLLNAAVQRCRAERKVTYPRAAVIKACLNRQARQQPHSEEELPVMLDPAHQSPAYRLGRLFATLEKIQEEASPSLNVTIRERYYGAASSTPVAVFTTLMRLKNHHLAKLAKGRAVNFEKVLAEIMSGLQDFPAHLPLPEQGRFAVGYYHQRQAFFTKPPATHANAAGDASETPST